MTIRRWHDPEAIAAVLGPHEPRTTPIVGSVRARGTRRGIRVWRVGDAAVPSAVLCSTRLCLDRWVATVFETEPGAARAFAPLLDRSPVRRVNGPAATVEALVGDLTRVAGVVRLPFLALPAPIPLLDEPEPHGRPAVAADLERLVALLRHERLVFAPTVPRLRRVLARAVRDGDVVVLEDDDRIVGAIRFEHRTDAYVWTASMVVDPAERGRRLSRRLMTVGAHHVAALGLGTAMTIAPTNPIRPRSDQAEQRTRMLQDRPDIVANVGSWMADPGAPDAPAWGYATLGVRPRSRIFRRAWRALELIEGPVAPGRTATGPPGPADQA